LVDQWERGEKEYEQVDEIAEHNLPSRTVSWERARDHKRENFQGTNSTGDLKHRYRTQQEVSAEQKEAVEPVNQGGEKY